MREVITAMVAALVAALVVALGCACEPPARASSHACDATAIDSCGRAMAFARLCCREAGAPSADVARRTAVSWCEEIAATGRDPREACDAWALGVSLRADGSCALDGTAASFGAVTGVPWCCCDGSRPCVRHQSGRATCGEAP